MLTSGSAKRRPHVSSGSLASVLALNKMSAIRRIADSSQALPDVGDAPIGDIQVLRSYPLGLCRTDLNILLQNSHSHLPDHSEGNAVPNIGRPLTDVSRVASSSMTSQCSAKETILQTHNIHHNPVRRQAEAGETAVQHQQIPLGQDRSVFISHRLGRSLDQPKQTMAAWRDVLAMLDVGRRPETFGSGVVPLVEKRIERFEH